MDDRSDPVDAAERKVLVMPLKSANDDRPHHAPGFVADDDGRHPRVPNRLLIRQIAELRRCLRPLSSASDDGGEPQSTTIVSSNPCALDDREASDADASDADAYEDGEVENRTPHEVWSKLLTELDDTLEIAKGHLAQEQEYFRSGDTSAVVAECSRAAETVEPSRRFDAGHADDNPAKPKVTYAGRTPPGRRALSRLADGWRSHSGGLLCGISILALSLGIVPFAPTLLDMLTAPAVSGSGSVIADGHRNGAASSLIAGRSTSHEAPVFPAATLNTVPVARSVTLGMAHVVRAKAGGLLTLAIETGDLLRDHPGAFVALRDFPAGAAFSHGQPLSGGLWAASLGELDQLQIRMPFDAPDISLVTIDVIDADGTFLGQMASALAVEPPAAEPASHLRSTEFASASAIVSSELPGQGMMVGVRLAMAQSGTPISWQRVEPRQGLVHVEMKLDVDGKTTASTDMPAETSRSDVARRQPGFAPIPGQDIALRSPAVHADDPPAHATSDAMRLGVSHHTEGSEPAGDRPLALSEARRSRPRRSEQNGVGSKTMEKSEKRAETPASSRSETGGGTRPKNGLAAGKSLNSASASHAVRTRDADAKWSSRGEMMDAGKGI